MRNTNANRIMPLYLETCRILIIEVFGSNFGSTPRNHINIRHTCRCMNVEFQRPASIRWTGSPDKSDVQQRTRDFMDGDGVKPKRRNFHLTHCRADLEAFCRRLQTKTSRVEAEFHTDLRGNLIPKSCTKHIHHPQNLHGTRENYARQRTIARSTISRIYEMVAIRVFPSNLKQEQWATAT